MSDDLPTTSDLTVAGDRNADAALEQIGPYTLLRPLGEGGMGVVYLAEQKTPVARRVALKVIKLGMDTREVVTRFEAERQALAVMDHPGIARVFDGGATAAGRPFFAMELVQGEPITQFCDRARLSIRDRIALVIDVCLAVQHAHQKGIIHRDLKPSNVLVTTQALLYRRHFPPRDRPKTARGSPAAEVAEVLSALGAMFEDAGKLDDAARIQREALALFGAASVQNKVHGPAASPTQEVVDNLVKLYDAWGNPRKPRRFGRSSSRGSIGRSGQPALRAPDPDVPAAQVRDMTTIVAASVTGAPAVLLLTAAAASYLPARRATRVDPVIALRMERRGVAIFARCGT